MPIICVYHNSNDPEIEVRFPRKEERQRWWHIKPTVWYEKHIVQEMPPELCDPYCLRRSWSFCLDGPFKLVVVAGLTPQAQDGAPGLCVGGIFPSLTLPQQFQRVDGHAKAVIELDDPVDLIGSEGCITLYAESR